MEGIDNLLKENAKCENFRKNSKNRRYIINIKDRKTPPVDTRKKRAKQHKIRKKTLALPKNAWYTQEVPEKSNDVGDC
ncbi:MAG: hypothetical protein UEJ45_03720 [Peptococcaceae bacterium]|nr:hypothetical protein [Peptococcaceae bacterium]